MVRVLLIPCLAAIALGLAPQPLTSPPKHQAWPYGLMSQMQGGVGRASMPRGHSDFAPRQAPRLRGLPAMVLSSKAQEKASAELMDAFRNGALTSGTMQNEWQTLDDSLATQSDAKTIEPSHGAIKLPTVGQALPCGVFWLVAMSAMAAGFSWWRQHACAVPDEDTAMEMSASRSVASFDRPTYAVASLAGESDNAAGAASGSNGVSRTYVNFTGFPFPLGPLFNRRTVRTQVAEDIWTFEQEQSLANVAVNVRMTAIKLSDGGLWIHNPIAPTQECITLVNELGLEVRYIVLGSAQYEHKVFVGPFARRWPRAKVFIVPQQWSWPLDLPNAFYGIYAVADLKDRDSDTPWAAEIDQRLLSPKQRLGAVGYSGAECAFFHWKSKTLICTDALVYVPEEPLEILDKKELVNLGRTSGQLFLDLLVLTDWQGSGEYVRQAQLADAKAEARSEAELIRTGWQRNTLWALFLGPDGTSIINSEEAFRSIAGRWILGPVVYALVYSGTFRREVSDWADSISEWDIKQIIPGHFAGPVQGSREDVRRAFEVLRPGVDVTKQPDFKLPWPFPEPIRYRSEDFKLLGNISSTLRGLNAI